MDYGVKRGLGFVAVGVALFLVGLPARGMNGEPMQGAFQAVGFVGAVCVIAGLVMVGKTLLMGDD